MNMGDIKKYRFTIKGATTLTCVKGIGSTDGISMRIGDKGQYKQENMV